MNLTRARTHQELRYRHPYVGKPRVDAGQRMFSPPHDAIKWTRQDQAAAIDRGYFVARAAMGDEPVPQRRGADNRARILPMETGPYLSDADALDSIEAAAFHRNPHAMKLIAFVEQQDRYGYSRTWHAAIERLTRTLTWYKQIKTRERAASRTLTEQGRANAAKRWRAE